MCGEWRLLIFEWDGMEWNSIGWGVGTGYFTGPFVVRVAMLFGEMFYRLTMLPYPPHEGDPPLVYVAIYTH